VRIVVIGAGVIGLTCAVTLAEAGHDVRVRAREIGLDTTSAVAAAIWLPYRALPADRVTAWGADTLAELTLLAATRPDSGIVLRDGAELLREPGGDPWWAAAIPDLRRGDLLRSGYADSYTFTTPVVEMPRYLPWLIGRAERAGVQLTVQDVRQWPTDCDVVVNATGLGGTELTADTSTFPIRGQVVLVAQFGLTNWWVDDANLTYLVPRSTDVVVGGTEIDGDWDLQPRPETAAEILERAARIVPEVGSAPVLAHRVGLRPGRPEVRLEREQPPTGPLVVHCYGHGGAGVTLSWGCASEVRALVESG
jgi:D-amino-acid oxidase